ncbi:endonuclease NucS domain-containing protein [Arsenicicoccus dermatophilus]|uniref:endonuclease NucS domain-containing protein n=1 Tax=Arsenicicoccus dermatophilus TaxID=1076331 RepID=UPI001F4CC054|nr:endonuclease NucS domain-containing protein [Arsenicicoccus dermatophilus]MCH8611574.1 endonuclease NucS [Arsenicicoccus dermatophilus]
MTLKTGLWRVSEGIPVRVPPSPLPMESWLENYLVADPDLIDPPLLIIGRQVRTAHGKFIDLLGIDNEGDVHVLELKRNRTPREVVAQVLDYGQWVGQLSRDDILEIAQGFLDKPFETAFSERFGATPPDDLNTAHHLVVLASDLDPASERIITYLREYGVPINAAFFTHLEDDGRRYLARSWLTTQGDEASTGPRNRPGKQADWNGTDWFVSFGDAPGSRAWSDGLRYGFVSAGGGKWYSQSLRNVPPGARVNVHLPQRGYVAVGTTLAAASLLRETTVTVDGDPKLLASCALEGTYTDSDDPDQAEWFIPVRWNDARPASEAVWETGMFANTNSACKLRQEFTLDKIAHHFDVEG